MTAVYIFSIIAIFILFLACMSFINLATAGSLERAREVGIRKTFGSERKALIGQILIESIVISFISVIIAFRMIALSCIKISRKITEHNLFCSASPYFILTGFCYRHRLDGWLIPCVCIIVIQTHNGIKGKIQISKVWFSASQWTCHFPVCDLCYTYCLHPHG